MFIYAVTKFALKRPRAIIWQCYRDTGRSAHLAGDASDGKKIIVKIKSIPSEGHAYWQKVAYDKS